MVFKTLARLSVVIFQNATSCPRSANSESFVQVTRIPAGAAQ
jgi:hypothetical protein